MISPITLMLMCMSAVVLLAAVILLAYLAFQDGFFDNDSKEHSRSLSDLLDDIDD